MDFFVKADSNVKRTGFSLFKNIQEKGVENIRISVVSPAAIGAAMKVIHNANVFLAQEGRAVWAKPGYEDKLNPQGAEISVFILHLKMEQ